MAYTTSGAVDARARRGSCGARAMGGRRRLGPTRLGAFGSRWSSSRPRASSSPSPCTSAHRRRASGCACRRRRSSSRFFPVLVASGWILLASQPGSGWVEGRIHSWSSSLGILGIVHSLGLWRGALAFGFGVMLALSLDGVPEPAPATVDPVAADEPVLGGASVDEPSQPRGRRTARRGMSAGSGDHRQACAEPTLNSMNERGSQLLEAHIRSLTPARRPRANASRTRWASRSRGSLCSRWRCAWRLTNAAEARLRRGGGR